MTSTDTLSLQLPAPALARFNALWGEGVGFETRTGVPLTSFLCNQLGISTDYLDQRVQTIFVNARAVDRVAQIHIADQDVIALSAAMPGLAGATLRKGGLLAGFRKDISHSGDTTNTSAAQTTMVTLKLFNLVARELGAQLLAYGGFVKGKRLERFFHQAPEAAFRVARALLWKDRQISADHLSELAWPEGYVHLQVKAVTD